MALPSPLVGNGSRNLISSNQGTYQTWNDRFCFLWFVEIPGIAKGGVKPVKTSTNEVC
jgi:hypothetical protein